MSGTNHKIPNYLGARKTQYVESCIQYRERREREQRFPHEHTWANNTPAIQISAALVSGWVGQGRIAIRFVGQHDNLWHIYSYPEITHYYGTMENP